MKKTHFHDITDADIPELLAGSEVIAEVDTFAHKGVRGIPLFRLWHDYKWNLDARKWKQAKVNVNVVVGKDSESFILFHVTNRHKETLSIALPAGAFVTLLPVIMLRKELFITGFGKPIKTKGDRDKNVLHLQLGADAAEVVRYGTLLFMDKAGLLENEKKIVAEEMTKEAEAALANAQTESEFQKISDVVTD